MKNWNNICLRAVTLAIMAACLIATSCKANAQRTMNGQSMVCLEAATSLLRLRDAGAEICYGQYLLGGYWYAGGGAMWHRVVTTGRSPMSFIDMCASGGYMHRIFCTRSRNLCLYAGGGAFLGYEIYDPKGDLPTSISTGLPSGTFLYGITPRIEVELFMTGKLALITGCAAAINFSSPITKARPRITLGLRANI